MIMHQPRAVATFLAVVLLLAVADASAQEKGKTGIAMGYPASVGFVAHVTERFAIRPELNVTFGTTETDSLFGGNAFESSTVGVGFTALFYLRSTDKLRPYISPRYGFSRTKSSSDSPLSLTESTATSHTVAGFFGAQYSLHDRFSVFGDVGVSHSFDSREVGVGSGDVRSENRVTGIRSGVGVIFYF
jgi:hypothetical protein